MHDIRNYSPGRLAVSYGPGSSARYELSIRIFDIIIASLALLFLLPMMMFFALAIYISNPGPVVFAHTRIGRDGRLFQCLKFRSMCVDAEQRLVHLLANNRAARAEWELSHKLKNDPRIFPLGRLLRKSSLDELPQLINVLRGEMSLVGPRPITESEVLRYGRYFKHYCSTRPGITGLWQISGRSDISYRRRVAFDVKYSRTISLSLNMRIIAATIPSVLAARGSC